MPAMMPAGRGRLLLQLVLLVAVGWAAGQLLRASNPIGRTVGSHPAAVALLTGAGPPRLPADPNTLTLVVFTDYRCAACRRADPAMHAAVAKDGHVRLVYADWPIFGAASERAARVALAADRQGIYPLLHQRLMAEPRPLTDQVLRENVLAAGGDWVRILSDLQAHGPAIEKRLADNRLAAFALGIPGTPAYLAGPVLVVGALDQRGFARAFEEGRAAAR